MKDELIQILHPQSGKTNKRISAENIGSSKRICWQSWPKKNLLILFTTRAIFILEMESII